MANLTLNIPGFSYSDTSIPIPKNDIVANDGTLDIFDALEGNISWPSQADPAEGLDTWKSLIGSNVASFAGSVGWSNGFSIDATADVITLPNTFKLAADGSGLVVIWIEVGTQAHTSGNGLIGFLGDSDATSQVFVFLDHGSTDGTTFIKALSPKAEAFIISTPVSDLPASRVAQIAVSAQPEGGGYRIKAFVNKVQTYNTLRAGLTALPTPTAELQLGGSRTGYTNAFTGKVLRAAVDDLSETTPEEFVAQDYDTHVARLSA